ncbi:hypothetical protein [Burkholderia sp. LMG 32019]|uniref:hypothetical protein n=1 Tax=Burkholderia sp. LMG 32019 TaxID=3158173 RepID=UPI003C2F3CFA
MLDQEQRVIERVLVLHDAQPAAVPGFRYLEAREQLQRFIVRVNGLRRFRPPQPVGKDTPKGGGGIGQG